MKKRIRMLVVLLLTAMLFSGCAMRTVEDMYALPKRSEEYSHLQTAIDTAMYGMDYSAPRSGDNQQTVQLADLDGDGIDEYIVFAKGATEKPLQVLIFSQQEDGTVRTMETIGLTGLHFEQVEYTDFDGEPGMEMILGFQVSDQILSSVAVYSFHNGNGELMLLNGYSKFITTDLDENDLAELMVFRPGEAEMDRGMVVLYSCGADGIHRSNEMELSQPPAKIRRIIYGDLQSGEPAIFVASSEDKDSIVTDIFSLKDGTFTNISFSKRANTSIRTLRNFYVYAEDIDADGVLELPSLLTMKPVAVNRDKEQKYLLRWIAVDIDGWEFDKAFTFHDFVAGWYLQLDSAWASRVTVDQLNNTYTFYVWDESYQDPTPLFTVYLLTDSSRDEDAASDGRFALYRAEGVAYACKLSVYAADHGITAEQLTESFHLIRQNWQSGDMQ